MAVVGRSSGFGFVLLSLLVILGFIFVPTTGYLLFLLLLFCCCQTRLQCFDSKLTVDDDHCESNLFIYFILSTSKTYNHQCFRASAIHHQPCIAQRDSLTPSSLRRCFTDPFRTARRIVGVLLFRLFTKVSKDALNVVKSI